MRVWMMSRCEGQAALIAAAVILSCSILCSGGCGDSSGETPAVDVSSGGIPIITYHYFREGNTPGRTFRSIGAVLFNLPLISPMDYWSVSAGTFERHLAYLEENGYRTVTMNEVLDHMRGEEVLCGKCVVLTFDDGDESVYRYAYPLLEKYGMRGTIFIITSKMGQQWNDLSISSIDQLREMQRSGVMAIESHTHDMHSKLKRGDNPHPTFDLFALSDSPEERDAVLRDLEKSRRLIKHLFGEESRILAWPFGFGSAPSDSIARDAGFDGICSLWPGTNGVGDSPYFIKRYTITARTSLRTFRLMASGRYREPDD
jgi:peptidoglycan/xylan/chitin deacetylase (PgdA/CDA1 family)